LICAYEADLPVEGQSHGRMQVVTGTRLNSCGGPDRVFPEALHGVTMWKRCVRSSFWGSVMDLGLERQAETDPEQKVAGEI
jgi:hypothetical protein